MLLPISLSVLSFQGSAIVSLVKDVGKSEPTPGSARRQLLASGVTFHFFNAHTDTEYSNYSLWLGRDAMQLTGYTELSPAGDSRTAAVGRLPIRQRLKTPTGF